jgi:hypothetical protein
MIQVVRGAVIKLKRPLELIAENSADLAAGVLISC